MRCWWCGVEPERLIDITRLDSPDPEHLPVWPRGDHEHAVSAPTASQLEHDGHETLMRIRRAAS